MSGPAYTRALVDLQILALRVVVLSLDAHMQTMRRAAGGVAGSGGPPLLRWTVPVDASRGSSTVGTLIAEPMLMAFVLARLSAAPQWKYVSWPAPWSMCRPGAETDCDAEDPEYTATPSPSPDHARTAEEHDRTAEEHDRNRGSDGGVSTLTEAAGPVLVVDNAHRESPGRCDPSALTAESPGHGQLPASIRERSTTCRATHDRTEPRPGDSWGRLPY